MHGWMSSRNVKMYPLVASLRERLCVTRLVCKMKTQMSCHRDCAQVDCRPRGQLLPDPQNLRMFEELDPHRKSRQCKGQCAKSIHTPRRPVRGALVITPELHIPHARATTLPSKSSRAKKLDGPRQSNCPAASYLCSSPQLPRFSQYSTLLDASNSPSSSLSRRNIIPQSQR
jgi:hypothetical protein